MGSKRDDATTALLLAAAAGHYGVVRALRDAGSDVVWKNLNGLSALNAAVERKGDGQDHFKIVEFLLANGANLETTDSDGLTPLMKASLEGYADMVEVFLAKKAKVEAKSKADFTALMGACKKGNEQVFDLLLKRRASVHAVTKSGQTPLIFACISSSLGIVTKILAVPGDLPRTVTT